MNLKRNISNSIYILFCVAGVIVCLSPLFSIFWTLVSNGLSGLSWHVLTTPTASTGSNGGLSNAIYGSLILTGLSLLIATPIGILGATWLVEFGQGTKLAKYIRLFNDSLLSIPSIIVGLFVYTIIVIPFGHYSAYAGAVALAIIALPIVMRASEDALSLVPMQLRESASALGAPRWKVTIFIVYRAARSGLVTSVILAMARVTGETAPLLFTVLNSQFPSLSLSKPMANLPVTIYEYAMSPYDDWTQLAWCGALLITIFVLASSMISRSLLRKKEGH